MRKWLVLASLQIKGAVNSIPRILGGTFLLTALVVLVAICGTKVMESTNTQYKMSVAFVIPDNDSEYIERAVDYLGQIETVGEVCSFVTMEDESAIKSLRDGSITAVIRIPENFIGNIMVGINTPAEIIFARSGVNNSSMLFQGLVTAAAADLSTAEAGIYSIDDACRTLGISTKNLLAAELDMNNSYLSFVIERGTYFVTEDAASTGNLTTVQFYVCTGIVMLLLLSGITCIELLKKDNGAISVALKRDGLHSGMLGAAKVLGVTTVFFAMGVFTVTMTMLATLRFPQVKLILSGAGPLKLLSDIVAIFVLLFGVFSLVYCLYRLAAHPVYGVLLLFILGMVMMFASGCFMPSSLLPKTVQEIGKWLPTASYFKLSGQILTGTVSFSCILANAAYSVLFLGIAALQERRSR